MQTHTTLETLSIIHTDLSAERIKVNKGSDWALRVNIRSVSLCLLDLMWIKLLNVHVKWQKETENEFSFFLNAVSHLVIVNLLASKSQEPHFYTNCATPGKLSKLFPPKTQQLFKIWENDTALQNTREVWNNISF